MSFFSQNLLYLRKLKNISRSELANRLKVNQSTISRWENEDMGVTVDNAYDVAQFFNVSIADLTGTDLAKENSYNELDSMLWSKAKELNDEEKKAVLQVMNAIHKDIDKELDNN